MLAIARYALKSPFHAATVVGILAVLSLFIPLVSILSGAIVGLIILTQGLFSGARALLISLVGITLVSYLVTQSPLLGISIGLVQWIPMMILAELLRRTRSLSMTLLAGMMLALLTVVVQYLFWPNIDQLWSEYLQLLFSDIEQSGLDKEQVQLTIQELVHWMVLLLVAVMYSTFIATLLVSRWFQAKIAGSEGFRNEFYAIKLGRSAAIMALVFGVLGFVFKQDLMVAMLMVILATFLYQGLAIVHSWAKHTGKRGWLVLLYVMMIIIPQVMGTTALLGVLDNWIDFRKKWKSIPSTIDD